MKKPMLLLSGLFSVNLLMAQSLPPIFDSVPRKLLSAKTIAAFPKGTWLENMLIAPDGAFYVTDYPEGKVFKVSTSGDTTLFARIEGKIAGIAMGALPGEFLVTGWDAAGRAAIFRIDRTGKTEKRLNIAGGMFPNGIILLWDHQYLIADSFAGCIWLYDVTGNTATLWLKDERLARSSEKSASPAANGLKLHGGYLYISNTEKQTLVRVALRNHRAGLVETFAKNVNIDDFCFDDLGNIYAATNVYNSVIRITPQKKVSIVADTSTGVAGSTAVLFVSHSPGHHVLYVSTSGGMAVPPPGGVQEGKIIMLTL
jgi:sugar lactone lactonase YvrE